MDFSRLPMLKRFAPLVSLSALLCFGSAACEQKKTQAEAQAEKVRVFRKQQMDKAVKSYQEIVTKYADSEFAPKAKERLQQLKPASSPAKK